MVIERVKVEDFGRIYAVQPYCTESERLGVQVDDSVSIHSTRAATVHKESRGVQWLYNLSLCTTTLYIIFKCKVDRYFILYSQAVQWVYRGG